MATTTRNSKKTPSSHEEEEEVGTPKQNQPTDLSTTTKQPKIVQYIFLRSDLQWSVGALAAQVAHASVAAIVQAQQAGYEPASDYVRNLPDMTKVVYRVDSAQQLQTVEEAWTLFWLQQQQQQNPVKNTNSTAPTYYYKWIEQPENIPTALATWPIPRTNAVSKLVQKKLGLEYF